MSNSARLQFISMNRTLLYPWNRTRDAANEETVDEAPMIRNPLFLYLAIVAAAAAAASNHADAIAGGWSAAGTVVGALPSVKVLAAIAAGLVVLSLIPFTRRRKQAKPRTRAAFTQEEPAAVAARVKSICAETKPDVPLLVDYTIYQAIAVGASDIHFDPGRDGIALRYRVQGMMSDMATIPGELAGPIVNRLKVLSNLVIYRGALPQDGRIGQSAEDREALRRSGLASADFRIAFMPTLHGERIVIRILGRGDGLADLAELGMSEHEQRVMRRLIEQPQGMIVLTGPTGSGKTTTIYAALRAIKAQSEAVRSIATLEDPIEYDLEDINQSQVDEEKNFTFDKGLRAILRQDPDVIMVGEIRDPETARIAIQSGMTGHLIITTVHAGSTAAAFSRLLELGVAPYSLNSSVTAVMAQRLVRRICPGCRRERGLTEHDRTDLGFVTPPANFKVYAGTGCEKCGGSGYQGRTAIFEILEVTEAIRALVSKDASTDEIRKAARRSGMRTLHEAGLEAVVQGVTSPEEIARVVSKDDR
jgi:type II secretory ATPase GspE/PulE/Tfp pilus assembly ATPase PilB-like protein